MTSDITIHRVPRPTTASDEPHPLVLAVAHIEDTVEGQLYGHGDFSEGVRARMVRLVGSEYAQSHVWVALPAGVDPASVAPDQALGYATATLPEQEDTSTAILHVGVMPQARSRGIGRALLDAAGEAVLAQGRTVWQAYAYSPGPAATGPDALAPSEGAGAVDGTLPWNRWLSRDGWVLELCERPSTLALDADVLARAELLGAEASERAGDAYVPVAWRGRTPAEHAPGVCRVMERMVTDPPNGGMEFDEQTWTPERLAGVEDRLERSGRDWVAAAMIHRETGEMAGYTQLVWPLENPEGVWQEDTLVLPQHRGNRLGMAVKAANLAQLARVNPRARRVHTWNAVENGPMLAINDALGFVETGLEGSWQKKVSAGDRSS